MELGGGSGLRPRRIHATGGCGIGSRTLAVAGKPAASPVRGSRARGAAGAGGCVVAGSCAHAQAGAVAAMPRVGLSALQRPAGARTHELRQPGRRLPALPCVRRQRKPPSL